MNLQKTIPLIIYHIKDPWDQKKLSLFDVEGKEYYISQKQAIAFDNFMDSRLFRRQQHRQKLSKKTKKIVTRILQDRRNFTVCRNQRNYRKIFDFQMNMTQKFFAKACLDDMQERIIGMLTGYA